MTRLFRLSIAIAITVGIGAFLPAPAQAQAQMACGTRDSIVEKLGEKYGEARIGLGLEGSTAIFEVWVSAETRTWTILKTTPKGLTCVMAVGSDWQDAPTTTVVREGA